MITIVISSVLMLATKTYSQPLETVKNVDLARYAGKWYEISSFPQFFQKGCHCTTADYTYSDRGYLIVENRCNKDSIHGKQTYIKGKAFVVENSGNTKLDLQFFWPFTSKYWIIDLAEDYSYSVVSEPDKEYLWILSRKPKIDNAVYLQIISRLKSKGFDLSKLRRTEQI